MSQKLAIMDAAKITPFGFVKKALFMQLKGMTDGEIRGKIQRQVWKDGVHYSIRDGRTWLHLENIEEWLRSGSTQPELDQEPVAALKSAGSTKVSRTRNTSQPSRRQLT